MFWIVVSYFVVGYVLSIVGAILIGLWLGDDIDSEDIIRLISGILFLWPLVIGMAIIFVPISVAFAVSKKMVRYCMGRGKLDHNILRKWMSSIKDWFSVCD